MLVTRHALINQIFVHRLQDHDIHGYNGNESFLKEENLRKPISQLLSKNVQAHSVYSFNTGNHPNNQSLRNLILTGLNDPDYLNAVSKELAIIYAKDMPGEKSITTFLLFASFSDLEFNEKRLNGLGIFILETRNDLLSIEKNEHAFELELIKGISLKKIENCALFIQQEQDSEVFVFPGSYGINQVKNHFMDDFLKIVPVENSYNRTNREMELSKRFIDEELAEEDKLERINVLDKSIQYLKENEVFDLDNFKQNVFEKPEIAAAYDHYRTKQVEDHEIELIDEFEISKEALKKNSRYIRSVIKLDKNFHVYVHGNRQHITRGFDPDKNMHYYQLYFNKEE